MRIERGDGRIEAVAETGDSVTVETDGWVDTADAPSVADTLSALDSGPDDPQYTVAGRTRRLRLVDAFVALTRPEKEDWEDLNVSDERRLGPGPVVLRFETPVYVFCRFDGPAVVRKNPGADTATVEFPTPTPVSLGFWLPFRSDLSGFTLPRTVAGLAEALTRTAGTAKTTTPDRSWPTQRPTPPPVRFGERSVPSGAPDPPDTGVTLELPPRLDYLLPAAPLIYYVGADVRLAEGPPRLRLDGTTHAMADSDERWPFVRACGELLQRTFWLDCVVRGAGPHGAEVSTSWTLDELGVDADRLYDASIAERVRSYRAVSFDEVRDAFPEWHYSLAVAPEFEYARSLPAVVCDLPVVWPVDESASESHGDGDLAPDEPPDTRRASGRLAPDPPESGFHALPEAYQNRHRPTDPSAVSVVAVANGGFGGPERDRIVSHYERRADTANVESTVRTETTVAELARLFESDREFVHFVGHRDERGLACADGHLDPQSLDEVGVEAFFLNACGSLPDGRTLIRKGAVAGGVTLTPVLDEEAAAVGTALARLLGDGWTVSRALRVASHPTLASDDYLTVGDGIHVVASSDGGPNALTRLRRVGDEFVVRLELSRLDATGGRTSYLRVDERWLSGQTVEVRTDRASVIELIDGLRTPLLFEGNLWWADELRERLCE